MQLSLFNIKIIKKSKVFTALLPAILITASLKSMNPNKDLGTETFLSIINGIMQTGGAMLLERYKYGLNSQQANELSKATSAKTISEKRLADSTAIHKLAETSHITADNMGTKLAGAAGRALCLEIFNEVLDRNPDMKKESIIKDTIRDLSLQMNTQNPSVAIVKPTTQPKIKTPLKKELDQQPIDVASELPLTPSATPPTANEAQA